MGSSAGALYGHNMQQQAFNKRNGYQDPSSYTRPSSGSAVTQNLPVTGSYTGPGGFGAGPNANAPNFQGPSSNPYTGMSSTGSGPNAPPPTMTFGAPMDSSSSPSGNAAQDSGSSPSRSSQSSNPLNNLASSGAASGGPGTGGTGSAAADASLGAIGQIKNAYAAGQIGNPASSPTASGTGPSGGSGSSGSSSSSAATQNLPGTVAQPSFTPSYEQGVTSTNPFGGTNKYNPTQFATADTTKQVQQMIDPNARIGQADYRGGFTFNQPQRMIFGGVGGNHPINAGLAADQIQKFGLNSPLSSIGRDMGYYKSFADLNPTQQALYNTDPNFRNTIHIG